ncbi:MAG: hypothetical protein NC131_15335 [Roseburia sp.]|nr:hypothetical protein [Roseburia sp.]
MAQQDFRTYRRRSVTRESGYHTCSATTGGECLLKYTEKLIQSTGKVILSFKREDLEIFELFEKGICIIGFGGYVFSKNIIDISINFTCGYEGNKVNLPNIFDKKIMANTWENIGCHYELPINKSNRIEYIKAELVINGSTGNEIDFISFDFGVINKADFQNADLATSFYQKTSLHIPYIYYFDTQKSITEYMENSQNISSGSIVVLKSCNRCGRFLPINYFDEKKTLSFSLHCKKKAPCKHSTFRAYKILNYDDFTADELQDFNIENRSVVSYFGHQLECKACKKFFVNAPLNPQRNAQQFKEDGLRRRAIEVLINELLQTNLIHFEYERKTKKQFSEHIWKKFGKKCFKCGKDITLNEMALDHTMPLAYLYRLDETATCLCSSHNSQKSDHFPVDYYSEDELIQLSKITGLSLEILHERNINKVVLGLLVDNVVWYFDEFLMREDYQKIRDGIKTADKINDSLKRVISGEVDLAEEYKKIKGVYPNSVTII